MKGQYCGLRHLWFSVLNKSITLQRGGQWNPPIALYDTLLTPFFIMILADVISPNLENSFLIQCSSKSGSRLLTYTFVEFPCCCDSSKALRSS